MIKNKVFVSLVIIFTICPLMLFSADYQDTVNNGVILLKQGMVEEAIKAFKSAERTQPNSAEIYYYLGEAYYLAGDRTEALENYKKAVELQDLNPDYHYSIALLYLSEGKKDEAIKKLDRVVEIAPASITGRYAERLRGEIKNSLLNEEMVKKWYKIEEERRKQKEEEAKETVTPETEFGVPEESAVKMLPVEQIVKRIKFGTETVRKNSSQQLTRYTQSELVKVSAEIISLFSKSKDVEIKRNLMITLGKVGTQESGNVLLKTVQNEEELFDTRIVALENIANIRTPEIIQTLRNTLKGLVEARETERAEARKNIQEITKKTDEMQAKKIALNLEMQQNNIKIQEIQNKIGMGGYMPPPDFNMPQQEGEEIPKPLTAEEILKLQIEERKLREDITKKNEEISKIDEELGELQIKKRRYENLLVRKGGGKDITMPSRTMQPEMYYGPGMPVESYEYMPVSVQETDEEKNEIVFALSLINALGEMRDKESLPVIRKAWKEYEVDSQKISYFLALARLSDYSNINALIERLKQDYPQADPGQEVKLRTGIIEIVGEYFAQRPDEELLGMIKYLSEEGEHPEIREAASKTVSAVVKPPAK
jgi:tetratricopeptide (TPR) repeat protein